jgi:cohesin loading factor subunit SCC2
MWNDVLALAVDAPAPPAAGSAGAPPGGAPPAPDAASSALRRRGLELIEVVLRGGHVAPWTAVAALVALCTDPTPDTRARALRVLKTHHEKHSDFVSDRLAPAGVSEAWRLHRRLWDGAHPGVPPPAAPRAEALRGLGDVYAELVQVRAGAGGGGGGGVPGGGRGGGGARGAGGGGGRQARAGAPAPALHA